MRIKITQSTEVQCLIESYPPNIKEKILNLRQLILDSAEKVDGLKTLEESIKWGEASYLTKNGSTIRIAWKKKDAEKYAMYFNCKTKLLDTFKEIYKDEFVFEGNRAIIFHINDEVNMSALQHCICLSLNYHRIKHLPMLGV